MQVQSLIKKLEKQRVCIDNILLDFCQFRNSLPEDEFFLLFHEINTAQRAVDFSLLFLRKLHPKSHFSFNEALKSPNPKLYLLETQKRVHKAR